MPPRFSWSMSRGSKLAECPRAYYFHYYLAHGGGAADAPREAREAHLLKQLKTRWAWSGIAVHDVIATILEEVRAGGWVPMAEAERRLTERMRSDWLRSANRHYLHCADAPALLEHEYRQRVPRETWQRLFQSCLASLRAFYALPVLAELRAVPAEDWLGIEGRGTFELDGVPVHVVLDLAYVAPDGRLAIVDWKTGRANRNGYALQLCCYALYAAEAWAERPATGVRLDVAYLGRGRVESVSGDDAHEQARAHIQGSIAEMRARLTDPVLNHAEEARFEARPEFMRCRMCGFRRLCERRGDLRGLSSRPPDRRVAGAPQPSLS